MTREYRVIFVFFVVLMATSISAQNSQTPYLQYENIVDMEIGNDSLPDFIISIKDKLRDAELQSDTTQIATYNLYLAKLYYKLNSYDIATEYNIKAIDLFEQKKDTTFLIFAFQNISAMYGYLGNSSVSIEYSSQNLKLCQLTHDTARMVGCLINLATSYTHEDAKDTAFIYYHLALNYAKILKNSRWQVFINNNIGTYYFHHDDYDTALLYFKKGFNAIEDKNTNTNTAAIYANIAEAEYMLGSYQDALLDAQTSIKYFENRNMVTNAGNAYQTLIKSLARLGKTKHIPEYLDAYSELQKKIVNKRRAEQTAKLKILYDVVKYESEIDVLTTANELKATKLAASNLKLYLASVIIFLTLIILIITIVQNSRLKKSQKMIVAENVKSIKMEDENIQLKKKVEFKSNSAKSDTPSTIPDDSTDEKLYTEIISFLDEEKPFKNSEFNLNILAKELNTNRSYISKAINTYGNTTFIELINEYRVNESKRLLISKDLKSVTIEAIGKEAGFNSKSTFFRVFKSKTNLTPSFFVSNLDAT